MRTLRDNLGKISVGTRVLVRVDYNVPLNHSRGGWQVASDKRLRASLGTILLLKKQGAITILVSHLGRPTSKKDTHLSLKPVANYLDKKLRIKTTFVDDVIGKGVANAIAEAKPGDVILLENVRFYQEEEANEKEFAKELASLADVYVNDAFSAAHRAHASTVGVTKYLDSYAGISLMEEVETLSKIMEKPKKPFVVIIGGAKISDKVGMLKHLAKSADLVLVGGASANTFLKAEGFEIFRSRVEEADSAGKDYVKIADELIEESRTDFVLKDGKTPLPKLIYPFDVVAAKSINARSVNAVKVFNLDGMRDEEENEQWQYFDIGPLTTKLFMELISRAGTVFWNGPMGVWENPLFARGTRGVAKAITQSKAFSVLGGGDTIAAAHHFNLENNFTFVSAAGGAALEFLGGRKLPGITPLVQKAFTF